MRNSGWQVRLNASPFGMNHCNLKGQKVYKCPKKVTLIIWYVKFKARKKNKPKQTPLPPQIAEVCEESMYYNFAFLSLKERTPGCYKM